MELVLGVGGLGHYVHWTWIPVIIFFVATSKRVCVLHQPAQCLGVASENGSCCWRDYRWHVTWHSWQLCGSFLV